MLKFPLNTHYLDLGRSKVKAAHLVNYFPGFWGKSVKNCPPSKLFLFTSLIYIPDLINKNINKMERQEVRNILVDNCVFVRTQTELIFGMLKTRSRYDKYVKC